MWSESNKLSLKGANKRSLSGPFRPFTVFSHDHLSPKRAEEKSYWKLCHKYPKTVSELQEASSTISEELFFV